MATSKSITKYPKALGQAEITPRNKHSDIVAAEDQDPTILLKTKELHSSMFELVGAYPYLFDVISYTCTHHLDQITRKNDQKETHYRVAIPYNKFLDMALDGYSGAGNTKRLKDELYKMIRKPLVKVLPFDKHHSIRTQPIRLDIVYDDDTQYSQVKGLKNVTAKHIKGIILEFYKPLWKSLFSGEYGVAWFLAPKAFNAKMHYAIEKYKTLPEFIAYGELAYAIDYRRLFLYLNMYDNKRGNYVNYDATALTRSCLPKNIQADRNGEYRLKNWFSSHQFVQKGLKLLNKMAQDKLMEGITIIPKTVFYSKPMKEIHVKYYRGKQKTIPDFVNETLFLPNGDLKENTSQSV